MENSLLEPLTLWFDTFCNKVIGSKGCITISMAPNTGVVLFKFKTSIASVTHVIDRLNLYRVPLDILVQNVVTSVERRFNELLDKELLELEEKVV